MPLAFFLEKAWPSIKRNTFIWLAMTALALFTWYRLEHTARADDVDTLKEQVENLGNTVTRIDARLQLKALEDDLRAVNSDLGSIEREIQRFLSERKPIPDLHLAQKSRLSRQRDDLEHRLREFSRTQGSLLSD